MKNLIIVATMSLIWGISSFAGGIGSGGGKAVVCTDNGRTTVESLDLWEAQNVWGYDLVKSVGFDGDFNRVMEIWYSALHESPDQASFKYDDHFYTQIRGWYAGFLKLLRPIAKGTRLTLTNDATIVLNPPPNCQIVQMLTYLDDGTESGGILVDKEYWDLLDDQNQIAFYLHETMFKYMRDAGIPTSDSVRKYLGAMFATTPYPSPIGAVRKADKALKCEMVPLAPLSEPIDVTFYVVPIANPQPGFGNLRTNLYFTYFGRFGTWLGSVEYHAQSVFDWSAFSGDPVAINNAPVFGGEALEINSIVGGNEIDLNVEKTCDTNVANPTCTASLSIGKKQLDGSYLKRQIRCEVFTPSK